MNGFFQPSQLINTDLKIPRIAQCGSCSLYKLSKNPKMKPSGLGRKKILIVGDYPGKTDDELNKHFSGKSGKILKGLLKQVDINLNRDCWMTNAVTCRPSKNETLNNEKVRACACNLFKTIKKLNPNVVILLGRPAVQSLVGTIRNEEVGSMNCWAGWNIPSHDPNVWICPTYHPTWLLKNKNEALNKQVLNHLRAAVAKHKSKPWKNPPSFKKEVEIITRPSQAANIIRARNLIARYAAFDYEGNCLKPEYDKAEIVSASICYDGYTIAFPFSGEVVEAFIEFLKNPCKKIASNLKFENRWSNYLLKTKVRNWYWDTMLCAHVLNNRTFTGLKFQSYVLLGQRSYNDHIQPFLESNGSDHLNRIHEIQMKDLLLYNGLDSLLEYKIAMIQRRKF